MTDETTGQWIELVIDTDYEIFTEYPYPIRRKGSDKVIKESIDSLGYVRCTLNRKTYRKHRIIAEQFIDNPNNLPQVDHINHNRADNRIENLRFCSVSENQRNKNGWGQYQYTFLDELPETAEPLEHYNNHEFDDLWIDYQSQKLFIKVVNKYRELKEHYQRFQKYYTTNDREGKNIHLYHNITFD